MNIPFTLLLHPSFKSLSPSSTPPTLNIPSTPRRPPLLVTEIVTQQGRVGRGSEHFPSCHLWPAPSLIWNCQFNLVLCCSWQPHVNIVSWAMKDCIPLRFIGFPRGDCPSSWVGQKRILLAQINMFLKNGAAESTKTKRARKPELSQESFSFPKLRWGNVCFLELNC